jgi:antitoxin (DNA-binding transcriptional repressor) of toxin-antitoxin stability system
MNPRLISKSDFKAHALELFRQVESSGESLVITDHGRPTLEVRPYRAGSADPMSLLRESIISYGNLLESMEDDWSEEDPNL